MSILKKKNSTMLSRAIVDEEANYRYSLYKVWDIDKPRVCLIMLNPSKADHLIIDDTDASLKSRHRLL